MTVTYDVWAGRVIFSVTVTVNSVRVGHADDVGGDLVELVKGAGAMHVQALLSLEVEAEHLERKGGIAVLAVIILAVYVLQKADAICRFIWRARRQLSSLLCVS
jgi:hypothetical protein